MKRSPNLAGRVRIAPALAALLGVVVFVPAIWARFAGDDYVLLRTLGRIDSLGAAFTHNDLGEAAGSGHFYRPLWVLWNRAIEAVFGDAPTAFHVLNILLFAFICVEVWALVARLAGQWAGGVGAVAFAVFPRHGESVAWVSGNTDLLAVALGLGGLWFVATPRVRGRSVVAGALLVAAALLAKEAAIVIPLLAALIGLYHRHCARDRKSEPDTPAKWWRAPLAMAVAQLTVLGARSQVVHGLGGYADHPLTARRGLGSLASYVVGALTPAQAEPLRQRVWLLFALALIALGVWRLIALRRNGARLMHDLALLGLAWFTVSILPLLNLPLDLNTANGERLLLLPSIGVAIVVAGLAARPRAAWSRAAAIGAVATLAVLSLLDANGWRVAGHTADRTLAQISAIADPGAHVVLLSVPEEEGAAHVFPDSLDVAVAQSGRPDIVLIPCMPVHVRDRRAGQIRFVRTPDGDWRGRTTDAAPFDVPVLGGDGARVSAGCSFAPAPGVKRRVAGAALEAVVSPPAPTTGATVIAAFDGADVRPVATGGR